jgi:uncharacterized protein (UPF0276 family)
LVEWDNDVPEWSILWAEARRAQIALDVASGAKIGLRHAS